MRSDLALNILLLGAMGTAQLQHIGSVCDSDCQKSCDAACQAFIQSGYDVSFSQWVTNVTTDPFYDTPDVSKAMPGDLLKWEDISGVQQSQNWSIPAGLSFSRFMYVSEDIDGKPVPATAWVLLPYENTFAKKGQNKLRTLVWNHGTSGMNPNCAPSNQRNLQFSWKGPFSFARAGYAVIGPDYAGLGSTLPTGLAYVAQYVHAADAAYSLVAARKSIGSLLSQEWVVVGHSEGGGVTWRTNERLAMPGQGRLRAAGKLIGAVPVAPVTRPGENATAVVYDPRLVHVAVYQLQSLEKLYPGQINASDYIGDKYLQRLGALDNSCSGNAFSIAAGLSGADLFKDTSFENHPVMLDWVKRFNNPGPHPLAAPMLAIQGVDDPISPVVTINDYNLICEAYPKSPLHLRLYQKMGHVEALEAAMGLILQWIDQRFQGVPVKKSCFRDEASSLTTNVGLTGVDWIAKGNRICA